MTSLGWSLVWGALSLVVFLLLAWSSARFATRLIVSRLEASHPARGRIVDVDGRRIHVIDEPPAPLPTEPHPAPGQPARADPRPVIVVLHGTVSSALDAHAALREALRPLGRCLYIDRPGHGYSTRDRTRDTRLAGQMEAVLGVLDALGVQKAVFVGHSFGGAVSAAIAATHPERVAGLVLVTPATHPWPGPLAFSYRLFGSAIGGSLIAPVATAPLGMLMLDDGLKAVFAPEAVPEGYRRRGAIALSMRPGAFRASAEEVSALSGELAAMVPRYAGIRAPTAVLAADGDRVVSNDIHARAFAAAVPGSRLTVLEGAGHVVHHTRPEAVAEAVRWVLDRASATPAPGTSATLADEGEAQQVG